MPLFKWGIINKINPTGIILAESVDGRLKWANGPYPIQIHTNFQILMGHLKFHGPFAKFDGPENP